MLKSFIHFSPHLTFGLLLIAGAALPSFADPAPVAPAPTAPAAPPATGPSPVLLTAGSTGGDVELKEDAGALNGTFAHQGKDYNPVVLADIPKDGTTFTIWIRHRGGPFELKGTPGGQQKEILWIWDKPTAFTWTSFGMHTKDELGDSVVIITGGQPAADSGVDAILIDPSNAFDPTSAKKEDLLKLAPAPAK